MFPYPLPCVPIGRLVRTTEETRPTRDNRSDKYGIHREQQPAAPARPHATRRRFARALGLNTMGKDRLTAFSDGVIAIIITIMVLELKVPHGSSWTALAGVAPNFVSYVAQLRLSGNLLEQSSPTSRASMA